MRVPDLAGAGTAQIFLSCPGWKARPVRPAEFEAPVKVPAVKPPAPTGAKTL